MVLGGVHLEGGLGEMPLCSIDTHSSVLGVEGKLCFSINHE